jgi:hypothetical protein
LAAFSAVFHLCRGSVVRHVLYAIVADESCLSRREPLFVFVFEASFVVFA